MLYALDSHASLAAKSDPLTCVATCLTRNPQTRLTDHFRFKTHSHLVAPSMTNMKSTVQGPAPDIPHDTCCVNYVAQDSHTAPPHTHDARTGPRPLSLHEARCCPAPGRAGPCLHDEVALQTHPTATHDTQLSPLRLHAPRASRRTLPRIQGPGSRVQGPGSRVQGPGSGSRVQGPGSRVQGPGSTIQCRGCRV